MRLRIGAATTPRPSVRAVRNLPGRDLWCDGFGRLATRCLQIIAVVVVAAIAVFALIHLTLVMIPFALAVIFASALHPFMAKLRAWNIPPLLATLVVFVSVLVALGCVGWLVTWAVIDQWPDLMKSARDGVTTLQNYVTDLPFGVDQAQLGEWAESAKEMLFSGESGEIALAGAATVARFLTGLVLMAVLLFFFLKDGPAIWEFLLRPFDGVRYERARRIGRHAVATLGGYARGTAIIAAVDAVFIGAGLLIVGVPLAIPLSIVVFMTAFIPIVGAVAAGFLAALVALVANGPVAALVVVGIVFVVNQLEGNFLQPVVMGRSLDLHALAILLALTVGSLLGGVIGAVVAVPAVAVAWRIVQVWNGEEEPARPVREKRRPVD